RAPCARSSWRRSAVGSARWSGTCWRWSHRARCRCWPDAATAVNPHDDPSAAALTEAVREFLERDVLPATDGRVRFHTRVAINVLAMVERELVHGPDQARAHASALGRLGMSSEAELAAAIRSG